MTVPSFGNVGRFRNPLDSFTSYSTHFVLLAARTTERAQQFATTDFSVTQQLISQVDQLGKPLSFGTGSDVFLVMDTRRFSQFTIQSLKYEVLVNGLTQGQSHGNLANEVQMTVLDSVGISFINYMQWLMDTQMQTNFDGMIFMLQIFFVGHHEDGSSETVQTVTIPMHLFKMDVNLDYARGVYDCVFMPNYNFNVNHHNRWLNIGNATAYFTGDGIMTLEAMVQSFEDSLNKASQNFYNSVAKVLQAGKPAEDVKGKIGRPVFYQITIPKEWKDFKFSGSSVKSAVEKDFKAQSPAKPATNSSSTSTNTASPAKDAHMTVNPGQTITQVLDIMLKQCADVAELANADKLLSTDKVITFYKYLVSVSSDDNNFTVHVDIIPFAVPNVTPPKKDGKVAAVAQDQSKFYQVVDGKRIPANYFELDYIFTGRNLDVLNLDMKIQDLQFLLAANVRVSEGELYRVAGLGQVDKTKEKDTSPPLPEIFRSRAYDPIMIPMLSEEQRKNFTDYAAQRSVEQSKKLTYDRQSYSRNLSAFYAQSPVMTNVVIKGNPLIMDKFNIDELVLHTTPATFGAASATTGATGQKSKAEYREDLEKRILRTQNLEAGAKKGTFAPRQTIGDASYTTTPVFVKLNIMGPNVDPITNELINGEDFATQVLYDNYYVVFKVVNTIEGGVFKQELELWSHNVYGTGKLTAEQVKAKQVQGAPSGSSVRN